MKICVYGAGAIGGYIGACLARLDEDVSLVARGEHLAAMRRDGLRVREFEGGEDFTVHPRCAGSAAELGPQDLVIVTLKAHQLPGAAGDIAALLGPETVVVPAMNGIPWWYFHGCSETSGHSGAWGARRVDSVDPGGRVWALIGPERVVGATVFIGGEVIAPGIVRHTSREARITLGEPGGGRTPRLESVAALLTRAGLEVPLADDIRVAVWNKLLVNIAMNPVAALTTATVDLIGADAGARAVCRRLMGEAAAVAAALGTPPDLDIEGVIDYYRDAPPRRPSMLQDLLRARPMEIEAIIGAVAELGALAGVATPTIETVLALMRLRAGAAGLVPATE